MNIYALSQIEMQSSISDLNITGHVNWQKNDLVNFSTRNELHVYLADITDYQQLEYDKFKSVLSTDEIRRADTFISKVSRKQFILSHYLLRMLLAQYLSSDPALLVFDQTKTKKPFLKNFDKSPSFNISHSGNKVLIGITFGCDVGVDIEKKDENFDFKFFAESHFSENERHMLKNDNTKESVSNFFKIWTCKESLLKLTGEGLTDDLKSIDVMSMVTGSNDMPVIFSLVFDDYAIAVAMTHKYPIQYFLF